MNEIKVIVVTHKDYRMPTEKMYYPICVGPSSSALSYKFTPDYTGDNISEKNCAYCELTALYWAWKNLECDYLGIAHYRRYFTITKKCKSIDNILSEKEALEFFSKADLIVPPKRKYMQTIENHYINCIKSRKEAHKTHLRLLRETIKTLEPDYVEYFEKVINSHKAHMFNMFIMKREDADAYCKWLFEILFSLEDKVYKNNVYYDRIMGAFGEFLLDVWILKNGKTYKEVDLFETERDTLKKIKWAAKRRFLE